MTTTIEPLGTTVWPAWEAFTSTSGGLGASTVRRLERVECHAWPEDEIHHDIAGWQIISYGDEPAGAFVRCWGRSRPAVEACLERLIAWVAAGGTTELYPTT